MKRLLIPLTFILAILIAGLVVITGDLAIQVNKKTYAQQTQLVSGTSDFTEKTEESTEEHFPVSSNEFKIEIPKIHLLKDIEIDVDPRDIDIYGPVLDKKVAQGMFTKLPDETVGSSGGNVYLFAHREGPSNFFAKLDKLNNGDSINLLYKGKKYTYSVAESFIIDPSETWVYTGISEIPSLTLQTCNNGVKERLIVKAILLNVT